MTPTLQIIFGSALLTGCALLHVTILIVAIPSVKRVAIRVAGWRSSMRRATILCLGVLVILFAHTVQVWTWALIFLLSGAMINFTESFYFAMVTYTTLGYGDLILGEGLRIFATFAAVTGLLTFGISTAFLIKLLEALFASMNARM